MEATCSRRKRQAEAQIFRRWRLLLVERRLRLLVEWRLRLLVE